MKTVFLQILDMSVSASILAAVVIVLRLVLKKAPKAIHCALWAMVALRLVCPSLPESQASLMPDSQPVSAVVQGQLEKEPAAEVQIPVQNVQKPALIPQASAPQNTVTVKTEPERAVDWMAVVSAVWLSGVGAMALYGVGSYVFLRRKVAPAVKENGVWLCDHLASPFILGILRPRIYLPSGLEMEHRASVLAHEKAHLRRKDHWWKPLGFALLAVHWFNPVMWVVYVLLCRDIEAACDERVVKGMEPGERKAYSEALLSCAAPRRSIAACPLAFGEQGVKGRIKSVLSYKKPTVWIVLVAVVAAVAVGVFFLTNPAVPEPEENPENTYNINDIMIEAPSYFELDTFKGIEVYVWEENGELVCGAMSGTNRNKEEEEIRALKGIKLEEMALVLDTYAIPDWGISIWPFGASQFWTEEQTQDYLQWRKIANQLRPRLGLYVPGEKEITGEYTVATKYDIQPVFGDGFFYAKGYDGLYRVYCSDMEGLSEGDRLSIKYVDKKDLAGTIKYQITAKKIFNYNATKPTETLVMDMRIMDSDGGLDAFETDCFYAIDSEGRFYRVYCDDMTGLQEWQLIRVTYRSDSYRELEYPGGYPDGGYTPKYEITAVEVEDHSSGEWVETMIITQSRLSGVAFESDCFYAYDFNLNLCRVYCSDMTGLYEGQRIRVTYNEESRVNIEKPANWSPKYEVTVIKVEPQQAQSEYVSTVYFIQEDVGYYWGAPNLEGAKYYAVPVTAEERDTLLKLEKDRVWHDTRLSSYLPASHMTLNVVVDDSWNFFSLNDDSYIMKGQDYALLTQEEQELIKTLKSRAALSDEAQNYFTDDWLVYQQMTKQ